MRRWLWAAAVILFAAPAAATDLKPGWIADKQTGCLVWNATPQPNETISWSGRCPMGLALGRGTLQWFQDGKLQERVDGEYREGRINGHAVLIWTGGSRFEGEFVDGKGHGVFTWSEGRRKGDRYEGDYANGPTGHGVYNFVAGARYEGGFVKSVFTGHGVMTWPNGRRFDGEWRDDKPNGAGAFRAADGQIFEGDWVNGCFKDGDRRAAVNVDAASCGVPADRNTGSPYLNLLKARIAKYLPKQDGNQAKTVVMYRIGLFRDGRLASIEVVRHSRVEGVDLIGTTAIRQAAPMPPVPRDVPGDPIVYFTAELSIGAASASP